MYVPTYVCTLYLVAMSYVVDDFASYFYISFGSEQNKVNV